MTTLYDNFIDCRSPTFRWSYTPKVNEPLVTLFKLVYGIDLSNEVNPFKPDGASFGIDITFNYNFNYGQVNVSAKEKDMEVTFFIKDADKFRIPFHSSRCIIKTDHNLKLIDANFNFYTSVSKKTRNKDTSGYALIRYIRIFNGINDFNQIGYDNKNTKNEDYIDLMNYGIDSTYLKANFEFELLFKEFMQFCEKFPDDFYDVFTEYPSDNQFIDDINQAVVFLNLFAQQYNDDNRLLKSRMLLLSMSKI